ncbi:hypothetical protein Tco_1078456 [Tanacetum coccineum]|uniref:Uncharacterized protein n=1 Tax=Tanacetum coccineum TaxID=301880 RepID=A0ABQ5HP48_9ASTR
MLSAYDSEDDISWKSSDDDQDDEQDQDDDDAEKHDVHETTQEEEDDDDHDDDENDQEDDDAHDDDKKAENDDDEELTESDNDDEEDSDNDVEGANVASAKSDEDATDEKDQGNEAVKDTNTDLDGRDKVMTDVEDTHVTLTPVNPDGQHKIREEVILTANQQFLETIDDGMKKIIKEQVKKEVSKIIPKVEKFVTDQLESEVLVRSSKKANTSHAVAANLSELELKKILIDKMQANNSINRSDIQRQLYKVLVEAYEADKILLDTYGDTVTLKRPRDGADDDEEPSAGTDRGSKRRRSGKEPASTSAPSETTTKTAGKTTSTGTKTHTKSASQSAPVGDAMHSTDVFTGPADQEFETGVQDEQADEEVQHLPDWFQKPTRLPSPDHAWNTSVPAVHETVQPWLSSLAQQDPRESFDELTDSTFDFSAFVLNRLNVYKATTESIRLDQPEVSISRIICDSHYLRRDDDVLYKFKEGDFHRLRIQDIEDMLLLLVQGKVTNLSVEERIAFNVSLRMFTRRVVIQRRVEDLQLGVESYQKKLNLTKPDTYRSNLRRQDAYTPYSDPRGFIYENKDKKNRLMRIDELHKFSDGTLDDVRTVLNDRLKGIRMEYLPQTFWNPRDKANARAMIQAIDKRLKTRRIMRSLERFVGGRPYGGDLRLLQRTI